MPTIQPIRRLVYLYSDHGFARPKDAPLWERKSLDWSAFVKVICNEPDIKTRHIAPTEEAKSHAPAILFGGPDVSDVEQHGEKMYAPKTQDSIAFRTALSFDFDVVPYNFLKEVRSLSCYWLIHSTWRATKENPRYRLFIPLAQNIPVSEYEITAKLFAGQHPGWLAALEHDSTTFRYDQCSVLPIIQAKEAFYHAEHGGDHFLTLDEIPEADNAQLKLPKGKRKKTYFEEVFEKAGAHYVLPDSVPEGGRNVALLAYAGHMVTHIRGGDVSQREKTLHDSLEAFNADHLDPPLPTSEVESVFRSARKFKNWGAAIKGDAPAYTPDEAATMGIAYTPPKPPAADDIISDVPTPESFRRVCMALKKHYSPRAQKWVVDKDQKLTNLLYIISLDDRFKSLRMNDLTCKVEVDRPLWSGDQPGDTPQWKATDSAQLAAYIENAYKIRYTDDDIATHGVEVVAQQPGRRYHPIKRYFETLTPWDGVPRMETALVDYLGAEDSPYVRQVTSKFFFACIQRIYRPGCHFPTILILIGPQGCGKSTFLQKIALSNDYYSDAIAVSDMKNLKTIGELTSGYWILELPEWAGLRKTDSNTIKKYASSRVDVYRRAYGREAEAHPRQFVLAGTTNDLVISNDLTGGRRFWPVEVRKVGDITTRLTRDTVDQIWAEAYQKWTEQGRNVNLNLEGEAVQMAAQAAQQAATADDLTLTIVCELLSWKYPANWASLSLETRTYFLQNYDASKNDARSFFATGYNDQRLKGKGFLSDISPYDLAEMVRIRRGLKGDVRPAEVADVRRVLKVLGAEEEKNANHVDTSGQRRRRYHISDEVRKKIQKMSGIYMNEILDFDPGAYADDFPI